MKQATLLLILALCCTAAMAQVQVPLSLVSTAGGTGSATIAGSASTIEWTIGETIIGGGTANNQSITIGEQQNTLVPDTTTGISNTFFSAVKVYPNPANSLIHIDNMPQGEKSISITDAAGKNVQAINTNESAENINTAGLAAGIYMLGLSTKGDGQVAYKIIINK